ARQGASLRGSVRLVRAVRLPLVQRQRAGGNLRRALGAGDPGARRSRRTEGSTMNHLGIFISGAIVTLVVAASLTLLIWGAILDGREEERQRALRGQRDLEAVRAARNVHSIGERIPAAAQPSTKGTA